MRRCRTPQEVAAITQLLLTAAQQLAGELQRLTGGAAGAASVGPPAAVLGGPGSALGCVSGAGDAGSTATQAHGTAALLGAVGQSPQAQAQSKAGAQGTGNPPQLGQEEPEDQPTTGRQPAEVRAAGAHERSSPSSPPQPGGSRTGQATGPGQPAAAAAGPCMNPASQPASYPPAAQPQSSATPPPLPLSSGRAQPRSSTEVLRELVADFLARLRPLDVSR